MNIPRIRAQRILDQVQAIQLALGGDERAEGLLRIAAGEDEKSVSKWVMKKQIERGENEMQRKLNHGD